MSFATILFKDIEVGAEKVLSFIAGVQGKSPGAVAALGVLLGAVAQAVGDVSGAAAASGLNIALDAQTVSDLKAVWPDVKALASSLGIKL